MSQQPIIPTPSKGASIIATVDVSLHLLEGTLATLGPIIPGGPLPAELVALLTAAIDNLVKFQGQAVTFGQLEDMRLKPTWPVVSA